jgi:cytochrome c oxidase assembly protein subunit 11
MMDPAKRRTALTVIGVATVMLGVAFASKPLYDTFCRVTGFGGTTQVATSFSGTAINRFVDVRFDANVRGGLPVHFVPETKSARVQVGRNTLAFYEVRNDGDRPVEIVATYNVAPHKMGPVFVKLECFCFEDQVIAAGETRRYPVVFYIDPAIAEDRLLDDVEMVTLSYSFFESKRAEKTAGVDNPSREQQG